MAADTLVEELITKAARILPQLPERGINVSAAYVAYEIEASQWMMLVVTSQSPISDSKLTFYDSIQSIANDLDIDINLGQVVQIRDREAPVDMLRSAARAYRHGKRPSPLGFGAWSFAEIYEVFESDFTPARRFEREVIASLQRIAREDWTLTPSVRIRNPPTEVDVLIESNRSILAIEVKYTSAPLGAKSVITLLGQQRVLQQLYPDIRMLLISWSGFSAPALATAEPFRDVRLVSWETVQRAGLGELQAAITELLTTR